MAEKSLNYDEKGIGGHTIRERRSTQKDKIFLNMAGEFAVASELNRRHVLASVTYGASKSADIFALDDDMRRVVRIELKTTDEKKWVLGNAVSELPSADVFWVLVQLSPPGQPPKFFVFSAQEIHDIGRKNQDEYERGYETRHRQKFEGPGVPNVLLDARVLACEGGSQVGSKRLGDV